ncbi:cell filamentation protein Fic [Pantoea deleyi]|uniref:protein adenylyltransferase n=1 Tax=Pantoea deleyi TaxID=470932 RepID=A0A506QCB5_9GAMM|nr:putative adenosine monophosphate-protein transferase Fic [Pantoea deleyi]ORM80543.1 cell filamentation protein Fic [Pantoea deleyi]TPV42938.1 putative adenosine monophosphate-protein transferase Fic [Pantoea deleyi]
MNRYQVWRDHYCYPDSDVLINRYNIRDQILLDQAERDVTALTIHTITLSHPPFSLRTLCHIHYCLFNELYSWAGKIRDISISKGQTRFCQPAFIAREADRLFTKMAHEKLFSQPDHAAFCYQVAWYYCELNILHPFREGNGRALRILFEHIILHAGYQVSWEGLSASDWLAANIAGYQSGPEKMAALFLRHIQPLSDKTP